MYFIPQLAMFGVLGALLSKTGFDPLTGWEWWAWFMPILILLYVRDWLKS